MKNECVFHAPGSEYIELFIARAPIFRIKPKWISTEHMRSGAVMSDTANWHWRLS